MSIKNQDHAFDASISTGLYSELDTLVGYRFHVKQKKIAHQNGLLSSGSGSHQAIRKGRGMIFSEVRLYQAGDDVRHIDWRVTARTQKTHTKVFIEEHERPTLIITEQTPALFFGTQKRLKTAQALNIAAILGWVALGENERVGGLVFDGTQQKWIAPKRSVQSHLHYLQQAITRQKTLTRPGQPNPEDWQNTLKYLVQVTKPGSKIFLIGDMMQMTEQSLAYVQRLTRHNDVVPIHIFDTLEKSLPTLGWLTMTAQFDSNSLIRLDSFRRKTRMDYATLYETQWQVAQDQFRRLNLPLLEIGCHEDPISRLIALKVIR